MNFSFSKYHGNGNDFIIVNNLDGNMQFTEKQIAEICHRRFGIGADGFILIEKSEDFDFEMLYYNSNGNPGSMCGNGGRCVAAYAYKQQIANEEMHFLAFDGIHKAIINSTSSNKSNFNVSLQMNDVESVEQNENYFFLDTGSPHYVEFVENVAAFNVVEMGRKTRYSEKFHPDGTNVNFVELSDDRIFVRTYERGVEDETLSCGTGVTASAIAAWHRTGKSIQKIHTTGGDFVVEFKVYDGTFVDLWLRGPAVEVFKGEFSYA